MKKQNHLNLHYCILYWVLLLIITSLFSFSASAVKDSTGNYTYKIIDGTAEITGCLLPSDIGAISIPASLDGYQVTSIGEKAFKNHLGITSITIPSTITLVKKEAFYGCKNLKSVNIFGKITYIGDYAFQCCEALESIYLPDSITYIGNFALSWCDSLKQVALPQNLESLEDGVFEFTKLKKLYIPESVVSIHKYSIDDVDEIYYEGSKEYWSLIENIDALDNKKGLSVHFNHNHNKQTTITKATLKRNGKLTEVCECGYSKQTTIYKISSIKLNENEYLSNGKEFIPVLTIKDSAGNLLVENNDYIVTTTEPLIEPGVYDVNIDFIGFYEGSKNQTLTIYSPTTKIELNAKKVNIAINQKTVIKATVLPSTAKQVVKFSSNNTDIVSVSSKGTIKGLSKGTAKITVTAADGKTETVVVKVCNVKLNATKKTLNIGQKYTLKISNSNYTVEKWKTSDKNIVAINQDGLIKGKSVGTATITATLNNGIKLTATITIKKASLSTTKMNLYIYNTKALTLKNASTTVKWSSANNKIAKVDSKGVVSGIKTGTTTITATCGGVKYTCKVTVKNQAPISIQGVNITTSSGFVRPQIKVKNNTNKDIKYIVFYAEFKNKFGDPAYCEATGKYAFKLEASTGLLSKASKTFKWNAVMRNYYVSRVDINKAVITFIDNTKTTVKLNSYWYGSDYYY